MGIRSAVKLMVKMGITPPPYYLVTPEEAKYIRSKLNQRK